ncbi:ribonuclease H2 subunit C [Fopius arisanus]|uniref:Ribonuclease H2 subunit C n=1 Tax=Fopius arisanus TaxID=64838 RepID=A0A9R1U2I3_9HYME|nr:PREDICTED: ribonuclease H2 subunit C [Fopius arisanus]XP_011304802.1 PREDICTED: ribonuclease H2 subunit C [Fopius arisanus]
MSIHLDIKKEHTEVEQETVLHSIPCKIYGDTPANVSAFFTPYIRKSDEKHFDASFRGHPLQGRILTVPEGYKGLIFYEQKKPANPADDRKFVSTGGFSKFTYWNFDKLPSKNDAIVSALDWIDIAEAVHAPEKS